MQALTKNVKLSPSDGWYLIATNPDAVTLTSNSSGEWAIFITSGAPPSPSANGEVFTSRDSWISGEFEGALYVKTMSRMVDFGYTVMGGV